jgi:hypothetical protein
VPDNWNIVISKLKNEYPVSLDSGPPYRPQLQQPGSASPPYNPLTPTSPPYNPLTPPSQPQTGLPPYNPVVFTPKTPEGPPPSSQSVSPPYNPVVFTPQTPEGPPPPLSQFQPKITEPVYIPVIYTPQPNNNAFNNSQEIDEGVEESKNNENKKENELSQKGGNKDTSSLLTDIIDLDSDKKDDTNSGNNETKKIISTTL